MIALIAGEDSGDQLGADLIDALRKRFPGARFVGIGGPRMLARGFESWYDIRELSVMGFAEVVKHLPRLLRLRRELLVKLFAARPALTIGIDAPDFTLGVERKLKAAGLVTAHYVSPSVWAWREKRAEKIGQSAERRALPVPDGAADLREAWRRRALRRPSPRRPLSHGGRP